MFNRIMIALIGFYQTYISRLLPFACRFRPSCSEYSLQAFKKYGFLKAFYLSLTRIIRCNPYCRGGDDPLK